VAERPERKRYKKKKGRTGRFWTPPKETTKGGEKTSLLENPVRRAVVLFLKVAGHVGGFSKKHLRGMEKNHSSIPHEDPLLWPAAQGNLNQKDRAKKRENCELEPKAEERCAHLRTLISARSPQDVRRNKH